jgi:hypothetical protein
MTAALTEPPKRHIAAQLLGIALLSGCSGPAAGPEEQIRAWVQHGQEAAQSRDRGELMDMISPAYADARGNSRDDLGNIMRILFLRQGQGGIMLLTHIDVLTIHGDSAADLVLDVGMAGSDAGALGFSADAYRFEMELERDGDEWLLIAARWGGLGDKVY